MKFLSAALVVKNDLVVTVITQNKQPSYHSSQNKDLTGMPKIGREKLVCLSIICIIVFYYFSLPKSISERAYLNQIYRYANHKESNVSSEDIQIVMVVEAKTDLKIYKYALDTVKCYCAIHGYKLEIVPDNMFENNCTHKDKFFRRHCVVAHLLKNAEYTLFLDADVGVVNPRKKIQEFIDDQSHIIHYDRFFNHEISAGGYIAKNSRWTYKYLTEFANWESKLPNSFHGTDNGALHIYIAQTVFPQREYEYHHCVRLYNRSRNFEDLSVYEACIRSVLGAQENFGNIKILEKGTGWARDNWLTNSKWNPERDFMIHGWKTNQLVKLGRASLPISMDAKHRNTWFNPLDGKIELELCAPGNLTWNYDDRLISSRDNIEDKLTLIRRQVDAEKIQRLASIAGRLGIE